MTPTEVLTLALVVLTLALVLVTAYYAFQTRQTVQELKRARGVAVLPRLAASIHVAGPDVGWLRVGNVGPGAAIDVVAALSLEPEGWTIDWSTHVLAPAQSHDFIPERPTGPDTDFVRLTALTDEFSHLRLRARYRDALGGEHSVDEAIEIRAWWRAILGAHRLADKDWLQETARELEKIRRATEVLASEAKRERLHRQTIPWSRRERWRRRAERLPSRLQRPAYRVIDWLASR